MKVTDPAYRNCDMKLSKHPSLLEVENHNIKNNTEGVLQLDRNKAPRNLNQ